jgi:hypothetical protein
MRVVELIDYGFGQPFLSHFPFSLCEAICVLNVSPAALVIGTMIMT